MGMRLIQAPAGEPVTLAEAKAHLMETARDRDNLLLAAISASRRALDGRNGILGRALMPQTWELTLPAFPDQITIPLPPLRSVTSVKYRDGDNVLQTLDPAEYLVDATSEPAMIAPVTSWPSTYSGLFEAVTVRFVCGYASADAVPEPLKTALLLRIQRQVDNLRPDDDARLERAHNALEFPYRILAF